MLLHVRLKFVDKQYENLVTMREVKKILPICSNCGKIRLPGSDPYKPDSWLRVNEFLEIRKEVLLSHGLCHECAKKLFKGFFKP